MIAFRFYVPQSFLDYSHPITIPKRYQEGLRKTKLDQRKYIIVYPRGETLTASMTHGRPGRYEYYQLATPKSYQKLPDYLKINDELFVLLVRFDEVNYAILEYIHKPKDRLRKLL